MLVPLLAIAQSAEDEERQRSAGFGRSLERYVKHGVQPDINVRGLSLPPCSTRPAAHVRHILDRARRRSSCLRAPSRALLALAS